MSIENEIRKLLGESKVDSEVIATEELVEEIEDISEEIQELDQEIDSLIDEILVKEASGSEVFDYVRKSSLANRQPGSLSKLVQKVKDALKKKKVNEELAVSLVEAFEKLTNEGVSGEASDDIEELDELSKKTLNNYIKKASTDIRKNIGVVADYNKIKDHEGYMQRYSKLAAGRAKGIHQASNKLAKKSAPHNTLEDVSMSDDIEALLAGGEGLTEEFKTNAATIFEAAVVSRVKGIKATLEEEYETRLEKEVQAVTEGIVTHLDGFIGHIADQWIAENELALESGIKQEMFESFMNGIKQVFEDNYVNVPEEKFDVLSSLEVKLSELEEKLSEETQARQETQAKLDEMTRISMIQDSMEGLTTIQRDKFESLAEGVTFEDAESFKEKLSVVKESYFGSKTSKKTLVETFITDEPINEVEEQPEVSGQMALYLKHLKQR